MKTLLIIAIMLASTTLHAAGYSTRVQYQWFHHLSEDVPKLSEIVEIRDDGIGHISFAWKTANTWTQSEMDALDDATVDEWASNYKKTEESDFDDWTDKEKALAKVLFNVVNQVRVLTGKAEISKVQFKTYLKDQM